MFFKKGHSLFQLLGFCSLQREGEGKAVMFADHLFVPGTGLQPHCCLAGYFSETGAQAQKDVNKIQTVFIWLYYYSKQT